MPSTTRTARTRADRHRRLAALDQPAADPQPVAVAGDGEAAEGDDRADGREQPGEHEQRDRADDDPRSTRVREPADRLLALLLVEELLEHLAGRRPAPAARSRAGRPSARRSRARGRAIRRLGRSRSCVLGAPRPPPAAGAAPQLLDGRPASAPAARSRRPCSPRPSGRRPRRRRTAAAAGPGGRRSPRSGRAGCPCPSCCSMPVWWWIASAPMQYVVDCQRSAPAMTEIARPIAAVEQRPAAARGRRCAAAEQRRSRRSTMQRERGARAARAAE